MVGDHRQAEEFGRQAGASVESQGTIYFYPYPYG